MTTMSQHAYSTNLVKRQKFWHTTVLGEICAISRVERNICKDELLLSGESRGTTAMQSYINLGPHKIVLFHIYLPIFCISLRCILLALTVVLLYRNPKAWEKHVVHDLTNLLIGVRS